MTQSHKKRQANFELLRIIAMMMVITLHYLTKGNVALKLSQDAGTANHLWNLIRDFAMVAVNIYVLISGYFLVDSKWHVSKVITLVCQVLFYSILTPLVLMAFNLIPEVTFGDWLSILLPIEYEHYWFATAYVGMYIFAPLLAAGIKKLSQKELGMVIIVALCYFALPKSINPYEIPTDDYGYGYGWFMVLFLIAGYIKLYGIKLFDSKKKAFIFYIVGVLGTFAIKSIYGFMVRAYGHFEYSMDMTNAYNYLPVLFSSVALFCAFTHIEIKESGFSKVVCAIAPLTFGVYLLHENIAIRLQWPYYLGVDKVNGFGLQLLHMIASVFIVFIIGIAVDFVRKIIFDLIIGIKKEK